ncbi:MAG TPA: alpha/beta fold hydrolase [Isosphaeraceae bacterium]
MSSALWIGLAAAGLSLAAVCLFLLYVYVRYAPIILRIFEEKPLFFPLRSAPTGDGEDVRFATADGLTLAGTYFKTNAGRRLGVVVFCHEYLGDRWSVIPYVGHLRDLGFDLFSFDFRNHGQSDLEPAYEPLQWLTQHELADLRAALKYVRSRPDADLAGVGLFGVSRGGCASLCVGGKDPGVWGVTTDGAFPTRGTMLAYILRWAEIYVGSKTFWRNVPIQAYHFLAWSSRKRVQRKLNCRFPDVERGTARLAPRPLFMIHGEKDSYIGPDIARGLFAAAGEPKELWIVPKAKHNRCREVAGAEYSERVAAFFLANAPRVSKPVDRTAERKPREVAAAGVAPTAIPAIEPAAAGSNVLSH